MRNVPFVCAPSDGQETCGTTHNFNTTWQIKPQYQDGWGYPFPPGSEDLQRLSPPALPAGLRELPLFTGDRNVKRTAEPQEYNVLTLTHLYQCSGTLHKHCQTETLPSCNLIPVLRPRSLSARPLSSSLCCFGLLP